jgi:hypothetical protein
LNIFDRLYGRRDGGGLKNRIPFALRYPQPYLLFTILIQGTPRHDFVNRSPAALA